MRLAIPVIAALIPLQFLPAKPTAPTADSDPVSAAAVLREINLARENPGFYASYAAEARPFHMIERGHAVDEAIRFLQKARPLPALSLSSGMCRAAADHCAEQIDG